MKSRESSVGKIVNVEGLKSKIHESGESEKLAEVKEIFTALLKSLTLNDENNIKFIYRRILDEQLGTNTNPILIDQLKTELMGAYVPFYTKLQEKLANTFSPETLNYLNSRGANIHQIPEDLLIAISNFMSSRLPEKPVENKFRLPEWIEK